MNLISDHSPFWVWLDVMVSLSRPLWRVNPFWLTLFPSPDGISGALTEFLQFNRRSTSAAVKWDSLKVFLRGCLIREITGIKRRLGEWEDSIRGELQRREQVMVTDPTQSNHEAWIEAQSLYNSIIMSAAEKRKYFLQQGYFEEGENTGHLLALMVREGFLHNSSTGTNLGLFPLDPLPIIFCDYS